MAIPKSGWLFEGMDDGRLTYALKGLGDQFDIQIEVKQRQDFQTQDHLLLFHCSEKRGTDNILPLINRIKFAVQRLVEVLEAKGVSFATFWPINNLVTVASFAGRNATADDIMAILKHDGMAIGEGGELIPKYVFGIRIRELA